MCRFFSFDNEYGLQAMGGGRFIEAELRENGLIGQADTVITGLVKSFDTDTMKVA
jgi:hypothetical protein